MKLNQNDIGGELISIITKGMYADPKDALREYVQNGVDAGAKDITIKIRQNNIIIHDSGHGMDKGVMRKAVRVGMSDKNPKNSVGFMGIGLYSSFHLCDTLKIYSKVKNELPYQLVFRFSEMRDVLQEQKDNKIEQDTEEQQIALLSLLENHIDFFTLKKEDFPNVGTRVEMSGLEPSFFRSLSKMEEVAEYLERVVPLPFHPTLFKHGSEIQKKIADICRKNDAEFKLVNLKLEINGVEKDLYRPYQDSYYKPAPLAPLFHEIKHEGEFFGIAWGCLNSGKHIIPEEKLRGFLIKKHGFTIGTRKDVLPFFGRPTFFNRYMGEFIVVHPKLLPNASRSDFEYTDLRNSFYLALENTAQNFFNEKANRYQEQEKAEEDLDKLIELYKSIAAKVEMNDDNGVLLLDYHGQIMSAYTSFQRKVKTEWKIRTNRKADAKEILKQVEKLIGEIRKSIQNQKKKKTGSKTTLADKISKTPQRSTKTYEEPEAESLFEVIELLGMTVNEDLRNIINLIDERFIRSQSKNEEDYQKIIAQLKEEIDEMLEE